VAGSVIASSAQLEEIAAGFQRQHKAAVAAGVVREDELVWSAGFGQADIESRRAPDATTLLRIASITKTFTATAILRLAESGDLHIDDPAVAHLPELRQAASPFGPIETLTIRRMLSHESGLLSEPPGTDFSVPRYEGSPGQNLARAADIGIRVPPNSQWKYSNLAYQLLGEIVARVSGTPYPDYLRAEILEPLGLASTGFAPLPDGLAGRTASGYLDDPHTDGMMPAPQWPPVWAEGGLWSCVEDLARWVCFQLSPYTGGKPAAPVLPAAQLRAMHRPRYLASDDWSQAWGISWYAIRRNERVWVQHSGSLPGYSSTVCFDPVSKTGAVVLLNSPGPDSDLAMQLADTARDAFADKAASAAPAAAAPQAYRPLLGTYVLPSVGFTVRVEWRDGTLVLTSPEDAEWRQELTPTADPDVFEPGPGYRSSGEPAVFRRRAGGQVVSMFYSASTLARLDAVLPAADQR
jgi:CubicO group peptidase (beta-lactamase class C family)